MKKLSLPIVLGLFVFIGIVGILSFAILMFVDDVSMQNEALNNELHQVAKKLYTYKQSNGNYPDTVLAVIKTDELCVTELITRCSKLKYKVSPNKQDFRMAIKSFTWGVYVFHPEFSVPQLDGKELSQKEYDTLTNKYGVVCYACMTRPSSTEGPDGFIIYRKDSKMFPNPDEWPEL